MAMKKKNWAIKKCVLEIRKKFTFWFPFQSATLKFAASSLCTILSVCSSSCVVQSGNFLFCFTCLGLLFVFLINNLWGLLLLPDALRVLSAITSAMRHTEEWNVFLSSLVGSMCQTKWLCDREPQNRRPGHSICYSLRDIRLLSRFWSHLLVITLLPTQ